MIYSSCESDNLFLIRKPFLDTWKLEFKSLMVENYFDLRLPLLSS